MAGLSFASPWILLALAALPALWWLLRATPPAPKHVRFPAIMLLKDLQPEEETPAHTPWWLLLLRLGALALVIFGLAGPILNAPQASERTGPLVLIVDDGWAAARHWETRRDAMRAAVAAAQSDGRTVFLAGTAPVAGVPEDFRPLGRREARGRIEEIEPKSWAPDRAAFLDRLPALAAALDAAGGGAAEIRWLSDGLDYGAAAEFSRALDGMGALTVVADNANTDFMAITGVESDADGIMATVSRPRAGAAEEGAVAAFALDGRYLDQASFVFAEGERQSSARLTPPLSVRNDIAVLRIRGGGSAGATRLLDANSRRAFVGIVADPDDAQPLLSGGYYIQRALAPYADLSRAATESLIADGVGAIVMADTGRIASADRERLEPWIAEGGALIRFAGPRLSAMTPRQMDTALLPGALRLGGGRALGGALTWAQPQRLAPFEADSPFFGLEIAAEVEVTRQVLSDPSALDQPQIWARLTDGTPLVTARPLGRGWIILFHVTASPDWSTLPLSGLYVDMLRRAALLGDRARPGAQAGASGALAPFRVLDGYGQMIEPGAGITPATAEQIAADAAGPQTPPGFYGAPDAPATINAAPAALPEPMDFAGISRAPYAAAPPRNLASPAFVIAFLLLLADTVIALALAGKLRLPRMTPPKRSAAALLSPMGLAAMGLAALMIGEAAPARAQEAASAAETHPALATHLAYVRTGNPELDELSRAGLAWLSLHLRRRTALEPADPIGVRLEADPLIFYPLVYWPVTAASLPPSEAAVANVNAYLRTGGIILFDTRDADRAQPGFTTPEAAALQAILERIDTPPLEPTPADHVLTKSFYLLAEFPGRFAGGELWVQARPSAVAVNGGATNDNVSPLIIGGGDWASAWAHDAFGRPMRPVTPGGEAQRLESLKFGINLVMYALTGNYKADQVHVPHILERLGQ